MIGKNIFIIVDGDTDAICGVVETEKPYKMVQNEIDSHRKENYDNQMPTNWDSLKEYLVSNGYELIEYEEVYF